MRILTDGQALAIIRILFGLYLLHQGVNFTLQGRLESPELFAQILKPSLKNTAELYRPFSEGVVLPNLLLFSQLITIANVVAGVSLTLGLLTRFGALLTIWLMVNFMLMRGTINVPAPLDPLFLLATGVFLIHPAGIVWGVDGSFGTRIARGPVMRWLVGAQG